MEKAVARVLVGALVALAPVVVTGPADAGKLPPPPSTATVTWSGNGTTTEAGTRRLSTVVCDSGSTPWLLWVLSSSKASTATITIPGATPGISMGKPSVDKTGFSTFKYRWLAPGVIDLGALLRASVTATYNDAKNRAVLTIGQGCTGAKPNTPPTGSASVGNPNATTGVVAGSIIGLDADGDSLSYAIKTVPTRGTVSVDASGAFTYSPTAAARHAAAGAGPTTDTFTVTISDGRGGSVDVVATVAVAPANAVPTGSATVGSPDPSTGEVDGSIDGLDADSDTLAYTTKTAPTLGTVDLGSTTGDFTYTPTVAARTAAGAGGAKTDSFVVTISDGFGGSVDVIVTVSIAPPSNVAPTAGDTVNSPNATTGVVSGSINGSDADGDTLDYTVKTQPLSGTVVVDSTTGGFTYTPTATARHGAAMGGATTDTFTVTVSDGRGGTVDHLVTVTISPANAAPTATATVNVPDASTGVVTGGVIGSDADGDTLSYSVTTSPTYGTLSLEAADGTFSYTPTATARHDAAGSGATTDTFTVTVSDGLGGTVDKQVTVTIAPANAAPTATVTTGTKDATTDVLHAAVVGSDADGDTLSYSTKTAPTYGKLTLNIDGSFKYEPYDSARHNAAAVTDPGPTSDSFTITVSDGYGGTYDQVVEVTFSAVNNVPTVSVTVNAPNATSAVVTGTIDVTDDDTTATFTETFTYATKTAASLGTVTLNTSTGAFSYTPTAAARDAAGAGGATTDSFAVTVTDKHGASVDKTVTVSIAPPVIETIDSTSGTATIVTVGTFTDTTTGTTSSQSPTFTRSATKLVARFPAGNWEYLSVTYNNGTGNVTDTVYKPTNLTANASTVGAITKNTFTQVTVNLNSSVAYTMTVKYSGRSTGTQYLIPAV